MSRSNLDASKANLLNQQALLTKAQAVLANDQRQAERLNELFAKGLVAAQDRDNARTSFEASQAALSAQQAQVETARVQIATTDSQVKLAETQIEQQRSAQRMAQMRLDDTRIVAPFSGYISQRNLDVGAAVSNQAAATSNASIGILTLQEINPVKVQLEVPEREVARVGGAATSSGSRATRIRAGSSRARWRGSSTRSTPAPGRWAWRSTSPTRRTS